MKLITLISMMASSLPLKMGSSPFNLGIIAIGDLQFLNVMLIVSATLPFDNREASFWFGVVDEAHPFLIACTPYGGGGFVGIKATGSQISGLSA